MNIYIHDGKDEIPADETCYIIAKGGIYLKKKLDLVSSLTPVDKISFLEDIPTFAALDIPKIPVKIFGGIVGFFRHIEKLYKSEAIVLLYYNKNKKTYKIYVPEQEVSGASLSYTGEHTIKDYILIGSIHSHSSMSAFHSGTDVGDEAKFDGLHMTLGKMDNEQFFDLCGSIAINGLRVPVAPENYVEGLEVREFTNYFPQMFKPAYQEVEGVKYYTKDVKTSHGYTLFCGDTSENNIYWFNKGWLNQVTEKKYTYMNYGYGAYGEYAGISNTIRYKLIDGKLVKIEENGKNKNKNKHKNKQNIKDTGTYDFYSSDYYKNLMKTRDNYSVDDTARSECGYCYDCKHREEKIKLDELNKVPKENCMENYEFDFSDYNKWGW